jgi:hypothetical protein
VGHTCPSEKQHYSNDQNVTPSAVVVHEFSSGASLPIAPFRLSFGLRLGFDRYTDVATTKAAARADDAFEQQIVVELRLLNTPLSPKARASGSAYLDSMPLVGSWL